MNFEIVFVLLFTVATAVAILAQRIKVPYTVALVVAGLGLGAVDTLEAPRLTQHLLYAVFLPGLLFEAAFHVEFKKFMSNKMTVATLAIPGLIVAIALTAFILMPVVNALGIAGDFTLLHALVFSSLIAATDPIAVVALFKSLGAPKRLAILVEGESLINDGTAVVVFTLVFAVATGADITLGTAVGKFLFVSGTGAVVGLLFGLAVSWVTHQLEDSMVEITLTMIAAYGSFAVAEHFHVSGVIATVVAGMLCGNYGARTGMGPTTKLAVLSFWEYWAFALNSIVFLLIGLEVDLSLLMQSWQAIVVAFLAVMVARTMVVYSASTVLRMTRETFPWSWSAVLTWGGLRGSLSMVLVLAMPTDFPHRELLINMTFGVVLISILLQGLTIGPLLKTLGIVTTSRNTSHELHLGQCIAADAALDEIARMEQKSTWSQTLLSQLKSEYTDRRNHAQTAIEELHLEQTELQEQVRTAAVRHLLMVEKEALIGGRHSGQLGEDTLHQLSADADARLLQLEGYGSSSDAESESTTGDSLDSE